MVIVDNRGFIEKVLEDNSLNLYDFHESLQVVSVEEFSTFSLNRRMDVLLIDTQSVLDDPKAYELCRPLINTFQGVYFFYEASNTVAMSWVQDQASFIPKILGACSLPMGELNWSLLANQLQFFWGMMQEHRNLQKHMVEFSQELDEVLETAQIEMSRAKKIHEILIPKRSTEIKGVQFYTKYASGEGGGAEFTDLNSTPNKAYQVLLASDSYLISSSLMGVLNTHKQTEFNPKNFLNDAKADIDAINASKKKKSAVDILILEMDLKELSVKAFGKHKAEFYSQINGKVDLTDGLQYKLSKGEKFIVFSPGFLFNWKGNSQKQDIDSFFKSHQDLNAQEMVTELFFQIHKGLGEQFLKKDATIVMMEVTRHGIYQV